MLKKKSAGNKQGSAERVSRALGYTFKDKNLLKTALTHRSYSSDNASEENYERMEFLGDAVLELVSSLALYRRFPEWAEGELTRLRAVLVQGENLAKVGAAFGLSDALRVSKDAARQGVQQTAGALADALEACFGAVFLDGGLVAAEQTFYRLFETQMAAFAEAAPELRSMNPKGAVQELFQSSGRCHEYRTLESSGPSHRKTFQAGLHVDGELVAVGEGSSIKRAETEAARLYLQNHQHDK